jgi:hypothetical protein
MNLRLDCNAEIYGKTYFLNLKIPTLPPSQSFQSNSVCSVVTFWMGWRWLRVLVGNGGYLGDEVEM